MFLNNVSDHHKVRGREDCPLEREYITPQCSSFGEVIDNRGYIEGNECQNNLQLNHVQGENSGLVLEVKNLRFEIECWKQKYIEFEAQVTFQYGLEIDYNRIKSCNYA